MKGKHVALNLLLLFYSHASFAMLCPKSFNQIEIGDSLDKVIAQCGKPDAEKKYNSSVNLPQEWTYYTKMNPKDQATLKMSIAFVDNKVTNMNVNGVGLTNTRICNNQTIKVDDSQEDIKKACGNPAFITQGNSSTSTPKGAEMIDLTYNASPPVVLVFENGLLKERK